MDDNDEEASVQLRGELKETITRAYAEQRPILTHLNADTTWLLSIPYPAQVKRPASRCRYNVLIDPWLSGPQSDVAGWFSTQWHAIKSSVQSIAELDALLGDAESLELRASGPDTASSEKTTTRTYLDLIVVSHEFTDHCHRYVLHSHMNLTSDRLYRSTLEEADASVPVFATTKAAELIRSWSHFKTVVDMAVFQPAIDWRTTSVTPLPTWLGVSRLVSAKDALYYHSAVIVCIQRSDSEDAEAIIYTPHGVEAATFSTLGSANPPVHTLAFLHGLHDVSITLSKQLNLGAHNALKAQRLLQSKYWVGTHDEVKIGGGILAPFLRRKAHTLLDALAKESKTTAGNKVARVADTSDVFYKDLRSGESLLLR